MGNIITQLAAPVKAGPQMVSKSGDNGEAQDFSVEMDAAIKDSEKAAIGVVVVDGNQGEGEAAQGTQGTQASDDDGSEEMEKSVYDESVPAGLIALPTVVEAKAATGEAQPVASDEITPALDTKVATPAETAEGVESAGKLDESMKPLKTAVKDHRFENLPKHEEAGAATDKEVSEAKTGEGDAAGVEQKTALQERGVGKENAGAFLTTHQSLEPDAKGDVQAAKSEAAAIAAQPLTEDFTEGGDFRDGNMDNRANHGNAGVKAVGVATITQPAGHAATYEAAIKNVELTGTERAEVYEKLSAGVKFSIAKNGGEVKLSLSHDHLGNMNIKLNIEDGSVKARIVVESAAIKHALDADSAALKEVFAKSHLVLDRYTVEVADKGFSFTADTPGFSGYYKAPNEVFLSTGNVGMNAQDLVAVQEIAPSGRVSGIDVFI